MSRIVWRIDETHACFTSTYLYIFSKVLSHPENSSLMLVMFFSRLKNFFCFQTIFFPLDDLWTDFGFCQLGNFPIILDLYQPPPNFPATVLSLKHFPHLEILKPPSIPPKATTSNATLNKFHQANIWFPHTYINPMEKYSIVQCKIPRSNHIHYYAISNPIIIQTHSTHPQILQFCG